MEQHLSTRGLRMMHAGIARAMADDDARHPADRQYGVRHYPDWRQQGDRIEAELAARMEVFSPLSW